MGSMLIGLGACAVSSIFFGSVFVPVKKFDAGNGIFVQWVMSIAIVSVGMCVYAFEEFPRFEPLAMLGGMLWALGNVTAIPIMNVLGMGLGMLVWGITNCVAGWASGRFGLFGINATVPSMPLLNYFGLFLVICGGLLFSQVRSTPRNVSDSRLVVHVDREGEDSPLMGSPQPQAPSLGSHRQEKRVLTFFVALVAGCFYGLTFVPVIYMQDHPELYPLSSREGLPYVFSHYCGIFFTATTLMIIYIAFTKNEPVVNSRIIGPALISGAMWGIAQTAWFVANDNLSQSLSFPIISMVPGACAAFWSVFYFKEIEGNRNFRILGAAIGTTMLGAILVGLSK